MRPSRSFVFLPGASGQGEFWSPVAAHFNQSKCTLVDWPGFGDVPEDPRRALTCYEDLATMVVERLDEPTVLVGQSMGGVVAAMVTKRRPDRVSHLVLAATSGGIDVSSFGATDWRPSSRAANPTNTSWMWEERPDMTETLSLLDVPALLVWASNDPISPLAVGQRLNNLIPRSRLVVFDCDDHWVARIHSERVARETRALVSTS